MNNFSFIASVLLVSVPFLLLAMLSAKNNLKKEFRCRQGLMPIIAAVFCIVVVCLLNVINNWIFLFLQNIDNWLASLAQWLEGIAGGALASVAGVILALSEQIDAFLRNLNLPFWAAVISNSFIITAYIVFKRIAISLLKVFCNENKKPYSWFASLVYEKRTEDGQWYVKSHFIQGITFAKSLYYVALIFGIAGIGVSSFLVARNLIPSLYYPVISVILVGEIYFFLDGARFDRGKGRLSVESDRATKFCDYTFMRGILRKSFSDKLLSENTTVNHSDLLAFRTNDEVISALQDDADPVIEAYGIFMDKKSKGGLKIDQNYLVSGLTLLQGKSVLFNNPFYYDLIPYVFYPLNRAILRRKKVLIVLGRHSIEQDIEAWCRDGIASVTGIPFLWNIGILGKDQADLDIGIVTRSAVHDLAIHESNAEFFSKVDFVVLIEPSRLISTAQIGLNSIVRYCRRGGNDPVFCSTDKNCDGIIDALSHVLMTSLEEVSATNKHRGTSSYMCWEADEEHLQHRMLPNLSRYLGVGTELYFSALKRQVSKASWYGGEAFPVVDMHWIAKQYHYDLMTYAALPPQQALFDEVFTSSANMWSARVEENHYLSVEDESYNMYEIKRSFSTRAENQGFINVISTDYLLKDYMAANDGIFDADSKAIPYIVADYAHTARNVIYRLCLRLSTMALHAEDIAQELGLINVPLGEDMKETLWQQVCHIAQGVGVRHFDDNLGAELLHITKGGKDYVFDSTVIEVQHKYCYETGLMEDLYLIKDKTFINVFLGDLLSAEYVAENETKENQYIGTELRGHVFQKYLPGQFFTLGGKYYEMLGMVLDGRVIVRRAADHITGRPQYRQVRNYRFANITDASDIGSIKNMGSYAITRQFADISVQTPAYWQMGRYNDFASAKRIDINGVPLREYNNKMFLRIDFSEAVAPDKATVDTIASLMNEVFRTLYAENQNMIVAVTKGQAQVPLTYSLDNEDIPLSSIYIIEDSQMDIGLLVSVERNLNRIFNIICDYLEWHTDALEKSKSPPVTEKPDFTISDEERAAEKEEKGIKGFFKKIGRAFKKVGNFLKKLFGKKKKGEEPAEGAETTETAETPVAQEPKKGWWQRNKEKRAKKKAEKAEKAAAEAAAAAEAEEPTEPQTPEYTEEPTARVTLEPAEEEATPAEEEASEETASTEETTQEDGQNDGSDNEESLMNIAPPKYLYSLLPSEEPQAPAEETTQAPAEATEEAPEETPAQEEKSPVPVRKPYHQRYYLLYGGEEEPSTINVGGALNALQLLGFGKNSLSQARNGIFDSEIIEQSLQTDPSATHRCDYCGAELFGAEYEIQADGRERCNICSRTAVKTPEEFQKIYNSVVQNMTTFFGITLNAPIKVEMVNSKTLHKKLGKRFVPTSNSDARILGVAIRDKKGNYTIMLENGTPRLSAIMTTVHELTHIWQYLNWNAAQIKHLYGNKLNLQVYEGMAKWVEIQYAFLINESSTAKREELITRMRQDEYGLGFLKYDEVYPLSYGTMLLGDTPFNNPEKPL